MKRILFLALVTLSLLGKTTAQNVFDPNDATVRYSASAAYGTAQKPDSNILGLQKWVSTSTNGVSSGSGSFGTLAATFKSYFFYYYGTKLTFRVKFPKNWSTDPDTKKYPIGLFMHGAGEVACPSNNGIYNNEKQLVLGGNVFGTRVETGQFDGFLVYPQLRAETNDCWGAWGSGPNANYNTIMAFIDSLSKYVRADNDRLFVYGLSGGGFATWELMENYPTRVARVAPTSAEAGIVFANAVHIPSWLATGGKDGNPDTTKAKYTEQQFLNIGANMRRTMYPDLGHSCWDRHWAEPDFVPYMNATHKANPLVFFNRSQYCPDETFTVKLGLTPGFYDYEWQKDGVNIVTSYATNASGSTRNNSNLNSSVVTLVSAAGNEITVKAFGTYRVRFRRWVPGGAQVQAAQPWSEYSLVPAVIGPKTITQTPPIQTVGSISRVVPALDGKTKTQLQLPSGFLNYQWVRTTDNVTVSTAQVYEAPVGTYKAKYSEPYGCGTLFSDIFRVVNAAGTPKPDAAKNLAISVLSQTSLRLDWADNPNAGTNETGFEIYRATKAGGPYTFVKMTAPNVVTYSDTALIPGTNYYYVVRAVAETGAAAASNEATEKTEIDNQAPTPPTGLEYAGSTSTSVSLKWNAGTDNVGISRYDIYGNGQKLYSTTNLSFTVANLDSLTTYNFVVKSVDKAGNTSIASNQVSGYTHRQGLNYKYYTGSYSNLPNFATLTPVKTGIMDTVNAGAGVRTQDDNFAFLWEGLIYIPIAGTWTFETASDDASKLYLDVPYSFNATALVNNDGAHGVTSVSASKYLTAGYHTIAMSFAEVGGDEEMSIYWSNNVGLARTRIPKNFFSIGDQFTAPTIIAPSGLAATATAYNKINLVWADNSTNETGFEIVRSTTLNGTYSLVITTAANAVSYTDSGLTANTKYFYKIRAIGQGGYSAFANSVIEGNYKFDNNLNEANGGTALTGNSNSYTSSDKAEGTHSLEFNGTNDYVVLGAGSAFPAIGGYDKRTVALWVKTTNANAAGRKMLVDIGGNDNGLGIRFNSDDLIAGIASNTSGSTVRSTVTFSNFVTNGTTWNDNNWNHIALVYDVNKITLYVNGIQVATTSGTLAFTSIGTSSNASRLGLPSTNSNTSASVFNESSAYTVFSGLMDNVIIVNGALTVDQINTLRTAHTVAQSNATTSVAPAAPAVPTGAVANVISTNTIEFKFTDASSNETGFEVWRSSGDKSNDRKIATLPAADGGEITYTDSTLFANITYYYRVRATGVTANSNYSAEVNGKTLNTKPVIVKVKDFTMKYGTIFNLAVKASDPDGEVLTFSAQNLPAYATASSTENGIYNIRFAPTSRQRGAVSIKVFVQDGNNGKDTSSFNITVDDNDVPVLAPIAETFTINEGGLLNLPLSATDNNGTTRMAWSFTNLPSFATFNNNNNGTGVLTFKPGYAASGTYEVTVILNDGYGAWTSQTTVLTVNDKDPDETVQFDLRTSSPQVAGWNNIAVPAFTHGTVFNTKGNVSDVAVSLSKRPATMVVGNNGLQGAGVFPNDVLKDYLAWGFNTGNNLSDTLIMKVTGLDTSKTYNFTFHSYFNLSGIQQYVIGANTQSINYQNNLNGVTINNAKADVNGEMLVSMIGAIDLNRGGTLSGFTIKANFADNTTPAKPLSLAGVHQTNSGVKLTWVDKAYNEDAYNVYRAAAKAGPYTLLNPGATNKDSSAYFDNAVAPQTTYYYYVAGVNTYGIGASSDSIKVVTGNNAPVVTVTDNIYLKTETSTDVDFTVTDDPGDVITVSLAEKPGFVTLTNLGGSNYRITAAPNADHVGWYTIKLKAADNKGSEIIRNIALTVSDKNTRSAFIKFGIPGKNAPAPWNNWLGARSAGNVLTQIVDEKNTLTTFTVTTNTTWSGIYNTMGHITGNNSGVVPDSVLQGGITDNGGLKTITVGGLDNSKKYNIVVVGSMNEGISAPVEYISGTARDTLNARYNTRLTANLNGLTPVGGQIAFTSGRILTGVMNYMNALIIEEYDPSIAILNPANLYAEPNDRNSINLSWSDRTADEAFADGYILERATDSLFTTNNVTIALPANTSEYKNTGLNPNTKYWYRLRAKSAGGLMSDYSNRAKAITPASIVYVNFNYTIADGEFPWNNIGSSPTTAGTFDGLFTQSGAPSGMGLELTKVFNGEFTAGLKTGNNSGIVSDIVLSSDFWLDKTQQSQFKLTGLSHARKYRIGFFGSSSTQGWFKGDYTATYTINGRTVYLNSWMNSTKIVYIDNVVPDASGNVYLDFSTTEAAVYGFNGGVIIQDYTDPESVNAMVLGNSVVNSSVAGVENAEESSNAAARANATVNGRLYPNPFTDFVNIDFNNTSANNNISVEVYDLAGRLGYRKTFGKLSAGSNTLRISGADAGMRTGVYIMTLSVNGKAIQANKVIRTGK
jgi:large repetitive protein